MLDCLPHQVLASELSFPPTDHTPTLERTVHALSTTLWKRLLAEAPARRRAPARLCVTWREGYASDGGTTRGVVHSRGATWPPQLGTAAIQRASAVSGAVSGTVSGAVSGTDAAPDEAAEVSRAGAASSATERSAALLATSAIKLLRAHLPSMPQLTRLIVSAEFGQGKDKALGAHDGARHGAHDGARDVAPASPLRGFLQRQTTAAELGVTGAVLGTNAAPELGAVAAATAAAAAAATDADANAHDADADALADVPFAADDDDDGGGADDGTALDIALDDGTLGQGLPRIWIVDEYDEYEEYEEEYEEEAEAEEEDYDHFEPEGLTVCLSEGGDDHVTDVTDELVPRREGDVTDVTDVTGVAELVPRREGGDVTSEGRASGSADVVQHGAIEAPRSMGAARASSSTCCPICGHDLGSLDNAQLNRHVDDCLNLGHSHVLGSPDRHSSIGSQPGASSGKRRRAGISPASGVSRSAEEQSAKRVASLNTWIVRSSRTCDMAAKTSRLFEADARDHA